MLEDALVFYICLTITDISSDNMSGCWETYSKSWKILVIYYATKSNNMLDSFVDVNILVYCKEN